jgi:peroxiredoxin
MPLALVAILAVGGGVVAAAWTDAYARSSRVAAAKLPDLPWRPSDGLDLIGTPAPEWVGVEWIQGGPLTLDRLRGKVVLLRFWLTGCAYCTRTAPALNRLYRKHAARGLVVVGLHHPKSEDTRSLAVVRHAADGLGFEFPVGTDDAWKTLDRYWTGTPGRKFTSVTFLIDRRGIIRFLHDGGEFFPGDRAPGRAYDAIEQMIDLLLAESATEPS